MPAGTSWKRYLSFGVAAMFSMALGAQTVHVFYRPLDDVPFLIEEAKKKELVKSSSVDQTLKPK